MKIKICLSKIHGLAEYYKGHGEITIDPRQSEREMLDTGIHESIHLAYPEKTEDEVEAASAIIARVVWALGYRRDKAKMKLPRKAGS